MAPGYHRPGSHSIPPAVLGRGQGVHSGVFGYGYDGYAGYYHGVAHSSQVAQPGEAPKFVFHPNGGATF